MDAEAGAQRSDQASIVRGIPLSEEPGLGALSIPGYFREITARFAEREALVWRKGGDAERWTYAALWERSLEVGARSSPAALARTAASAS
jgi:fatty-acyl-CoA synthase